MRKQPQTEKRYLVKFHIVSSRPVKRRKYYFTSIPVTEEIGKKAAMELAEKLYAQHGENIKAVSAEYQDDIIVRTHQ